LSADVGVRGGEGGVTLDVGLKTVAGGAFCLEGGTGDEKGSAAA
jgi:hypothetical protein